MSLWTTRAQDLRHAQATQLADILRQVDPDQLAERVYRQTAAGDERKLRGIPAIGRGVPGCIPGTSPHGIRS